MENEIKVGNLEIVVKCSSTRVRLLWSGEADELDPTRTVLPHLESIALDALSANQIVVVNLTRLGFMNSSCIGMLMNFLMALDDKNAEVEVVFNTGKTWQTMVKRCTLSVFSQNDNVKIADICFVAEKEY